MSPLSESASEKAILMPAPVAAAMPTRKAVNGLCVAKAVAKIGASVETEPSIRPASPGCTTRSRKLRAASSSLTVETDERRSSRRASEGNPKARRSMPSGLTLLRLAGGLFVPCAIGYSLDMYRLAHPRQLSLAGGAIAEEL